MEQEETDQKTKVIRARCDEDLAVRLQEFCTHFATDTRIAMAIETAEKIDPALAIELRKKAAEKLSQSMKRRPRK